MTSDQAGRPRFNHVGFTVPRSELSADGRKRIVDFFGSCLGFQERTEYTQDGELLIMMAGGPDQFIVFFGHDQPTASNPPTDHFGMACNSFEEFQAYLEKVRLFAAADSTVAFDDYEVSTLEDVRPYRLHKFYVRVGTPFAFEVQYYEWLDEAAGEPASTGESTASR